MVVVPARKEVGCGADNPGSAKPQLVSEDRIAPATFARGTKVTSLEPSELQPSTTAQDVWKEEQWKCSRPQDT